MDHIEDIKTIIESVYETEKAKFKVEPKQIQCAVANMAEAYKPDPDWFKRPQSQTTEYDTAGHRCAYLHKYAMIHTGLVYDIMDQASRIKSIDEVFQKNLKNLTLCSLGSGPGTDILALMFLLMDYMPEHCTAYLIDRSKGWSSVFDSIIRELRTKKYSNSKIASTSCFEYEYLEADLLSTAIPANVSNSVRNADIVTMIKFISAAACQKTRPMIKRILSLMKPGSILLYIDNAAGRFYETMMETTREADMDLVFEPFIKHYDYEEIKFKTERIGFTSQYKTRVKAAVWRKTVCYLQVPEMDCQSSAVTQGYSGTADEVDSVEFVDNIVYHQCATKPAVSKGILHSGYSSDDRSHNIKLHSDASSTEEEKSGSCCLIM